MAQFDASTLDFRCSKLDEKGVLWLGTEGEGLWCIQGSKPEFFQVPGKSPHMNVYDLTLDPQGHLWLGTDNGILSYDYQSWKDIPMATPYVAVPKSGEAPKGNRQVVGMSVNHLKHVLMAVEDSAHGKRLLMRFNGQTYVDLMKPFKAHEIFEDLDAILWMSNGGYTMQEGKLVSVVKLNSGIITCAIQDALGEVWLGTDGAGVFRYDGKEVRYYGTDYGFDTMRITCLHQDKWGRIWMGTESLENQEQGISYFESGAFHHLQETHWCPVKSVNTIASDKRGHVWFAGENGALSSFNGRSFSVFDTQRLLMVVD
jgi:ligand-binding sensor domain-containing protein